MRITFDRVLNVLLLVAVGYVAVTLRPQTPPARPTYQVGEIAPAIADHPYAQAKRSAVLFVRSTCHYCTESMPFYRDLQAKARVIAISGEPLEQFDAYLDEHGLFVERATVTPRDWSKLSGTPTIVVVDQAGKVVKSWLGTLSPAQQREVLSTLGN